jgi:hypothetical protein
MIRDPIGSIYINYRNHIRSNLKYTIINIRTSSAHSAVTWCNHMPHWWHGSCSYKPIINHRPFTHLVSPYTGYWWWCTADYFLIYGSWNWYKLIRLGRVSCPRVLFSLLNGGPAFVYKNPDRSQPHSLTWLPWWQTKSAEIDVKQICNTYRIILFVWYKKKRSYLFIPIHLRHWKTKKNMLNAYM